MKKVKERRSIRKIDQEILQSAKNQDRIKFNHPESISDNLGHSSSNSKTFRIVSNDNIRNAASPSVTTRLNQPQRGFGLRRPSDVTEMLSSIKGTMIVKKGNKSYRKSGPGPEEYSSNTSFLPDYRTKANRSDEFFRQEGLFSERKPGKDKKSSIKGKFSVTSIKMGNPRVFERRASYYRAQPMNETGSSDPMKSEREPSIGISTARMTHNPPPSVGGLTVGESSAWLNKPSKDLVNTVRKTPQAGDSMINVSYNIKKDVYLTSKKGFAGHSTSSSAPRAYQSRQVTRALRKDIADTTFVFKLLSKIEKYFELEKPTWGRKSKSLDFKLGPEKVTPFYDPLKLTVTNPVGKPLRSKLLFGQRAKQAVTLKSFCFTKRAKHINYGKDKMQRNKRTLQNISKETRKKNETDLINLRKDLKLMVESKYEYSMDRNKLEKVTEKREKDYDHKLKMKEVAIPERLGKLIASNEYTRPKQKIQDSFLLLLNQKYFFKMLNRLTISKTSNIYLLEDYIEELQKTELKLLDKLVMMFCYNSLSSCNFYSKYRGLLKLSDFGTAKVYKSKTVSCHDVLSYNMLPDPMASFEQLLISYTFKLRYFQDNDQGTQEADSNLVKMDKYIVARTLDFPYGDIDDRMKPKAIYLDKSTLMNLLLSKFDYEHDTTDVRVRKRQPNMQQNIKGWTYGEEGDKGKSNLILLKVDGLLEKLNKQSLQYMMEHFQMSNMSEYRDFFHHQIPLSNSNQLDSESPSNKTAGFPLQKKGSKTQPLAPSPVAGGRGDLNAGRSQDGGLRERTNSELKVGKAVPIMRPNRGDYTISVGLFSEDNKKAKEKPSPFQTNQTAFRATAPQFNQNRRDTLKEKSADRDLEIRRDKNIYDDDDMIDRLSYIPVRKKHEGTYSPSVQSQSRLSISHQMDHEEEALSPLPEMMKKQFKGQVKPIQRGMSSGHDNTNRSQQKAQLSPNLGENNPSSYKSDLMTRHDEEKSKFEMYASEAVKKYNLRDPVFETDAVKKNLFESSAKIKENVVRFIENARSPMDMLHFGSYTQFRDMVNHKNYASLVSQRDEEGNNLLMLAAKSGKIDYVKCLLDKGFDINSTNKSGNTPLHLALGYGNMEVANYLILKKAKQNMQNHKGKTPWEVAIKS